MGVYLSAPVTEKESCDQKCDNFTYGVSSMQGWRMTQEDSHNCLHDFDPDCKTSLFAVYDGHGGAEVAKYCSQQLPDFIKTVSLYKEGKLAEALQDAFIGFDATLKEDSVIQQLKVIAGLDDEDEDEEDGNLMGRTETDMLVEEANMPIEELRAKYAGQSGPILPQTKRLQNTEKNPSPMIRAKRVPVWEGKGSNEDININNSASSSSDPLVTRLEDKLENGQPDNDNNLNVEKELRDAVSQSDSKVSDLKYKSDNNLVKVTDNINNNENAIGNSDILDSEVSKVETSAKNGGTAVNKTETMEADSTAEDVVKSEAETAVSSSSSEVVGSSAPSSSVSSSSSSEPSGSGEQAGGSGLSSIPSGSGEGGSCMSSGPSGSGVGSSGEGTKGTLTIVDETFDSEDSSADEEEEFEYDSEDEEEEDEEEEEEDEEEGTQGGVFGVRTVSSVADEEHNEEPGSDSGCTAVVAVVRNNQVIVANAGDSRCVLCRGGEALDMSVDHKPEDESERTRIEAAGGEVTNEGRVNGGLNLSRALGDHWYKRNQDKEAKEQMISAFPDIQTATLGPIDEFMVIACDGIWNFMTSQEVIDFVREQLKDPEKQKKPSLICEEIFDHCLAPNTMGDGTGCDNMTCIIVVFKTQTSGKRDLETTSSDDHQQEKRAKLDPEEAVSTDT